MSKAEDVLKNAIKEGARRVEARKQNAPIFKTPDSTSLDIKIKPSRNPNTGIVSIDGVA
jgi:hypothetical protein